jgi:hypothetical protein
VTSLTPPPPAGWYADPANPYSAVRWFDGARWTEHVAGRAPAGSNGTTGENPRDPMHWVLPTGRSGWSIAAGYVALFATVLWFLGPVALLLGIKALAVANRDGSHGRGRAIFAVVVGVLSSIALVWFLALP